MCHWIQVNQKNCLQGLLCKISLKNMLLFWPKWKNSCAKPSTRPGCSKPHQELLQYPSTCFKCIPKYSAKIQQPQSKIQAFLIPADITDNTNKLLEAKIPFQLFLLSDLSSSHPWITTATAVIKTQPSLDLLCHHCAKTQKERKNPPRALTLSHVAQKEGTQTVLQNQLKNQEIRKTNGLYKEMCALQKSWPIDLRNRKMSIPLWLHFASSWFACATQPPFLLLNFAGRSTFWFFKTDESETLSPGKNSLYVAH